MPQPAIHWTFGFDNTPPKPFRRCIHLLLSSNLGYALAMLANVKRLLGFHCGILLNRTMLSI